MQVLIGPGPLDPAALLRTFQERQSGAAGAVVSFTGLVRSEEGQVRALELEAYEGFAEAEITKTASAAEGRFKLLDLLIAHRIGKIASGEPVVFVATAAAHRRSAFEGADFLMDYLKSRAPFWKKSHENGASRWILPRPEDYQDAARWDHEERHG